MRIYICIFLLMKSVFASPNNAFSDNRVSYALCAGLHFPSNEIKSAYFTGMSLEFGVPLKSKIVSVAAKVHFHYMESSIFSLHHSVVEAALYVMGSRPRRPVIVSGIVKPIHKVVKYYGSIFIRGLHELYAAENRNYCCKLGAGFKIEVFEISARSSHPVSTVNLMPNYFLVELKGHYSLSIIPGFVCMLQTLKNKFFVEQILFAAISTGKSRTLLHNVTIDESYISLSANQKIGIVLATDTKMLYCVNKFKVGFSVEFVINNRNESVLTNPKYTINRRVSPEYLNLQDHFAKFYSISMHLILIYNNL